MDYKTLDSGQRKQYSSGMSRDSQDDKPDLYQWMPVSIPYKESLWYRAGMLANRGAQKYGRRNWELAGEDPKSAAEELERFKSSALRHMMQYLHGETDEDHSAAVMFNLIAAEMVKYKIDHRQMMHDAYDDIPEASQINWKELAENPGFKSAQDYWTEEEHNEAKKKLWYDFSWTFPEGLMETEWYWNSGPDVEEAIIVENNPDYAWVWEDDE